jgi:ferrochelatase
LGTPDSPSPRDVHRYLIEFLTDGRVIDSSWLARQFLVRGVIVPSRYKQSAKSYKEIWTEDGSPLKVYGYRVRDGLQKRLGDDFHVELGMRYKNPSLDHVMEAFRKMRFKRILVLPLFPQYASATTGSVHQKVMEIVSRWEVIPEMIFMDEYATDPGLIKSFAHVAGSFDINAYDHVLLSFHGLPQRQLTKVDQCGHCLQKEGCCTTMVADNQNCYSAQCYATARGIVEELKLDKSRYSISFQSRLGKEPWLQPYTSDVIADLARRGKKRMLVFCPAFVCDCLETIYEIGEEYALEFKKEGGEKLDLVPGLNDHPVWIDALRDIVLQKLGH